MCPKCSGLFSGILARNIRSFVLFSSLFLNAPTPLFSGIETGADFLKISVGARPVSLGQAYTALANDTDSLQWNVAGMARMARGNGQSLGGISFSHISLFDENNLDNAGVVLPAAGLGPRTHLGISITRFSIQSQERRGLDRSSQGSFGGNDVALGFALASRFKTLNLGSQVKWIRQELAGETAQGYAIDLGFQSPTPLNKLSLGGSIRNLGPRMKFVSEEYSLPLALSLGVAFQPIQNLSLVFDVHSRPYQDQIFFAVGTEFTPIGVMTLRAGYLAKLTDAITNNQRDETNRGNMGGLSGMTGGLGFQIQKLNVDYAFTPFGELGNSQTITISSFFGGTTEIREINSKFKDGFEKSHSFESSQETQKSGESERRIIFIIPFEKDLLNIGSWQD